MEYRKFDQFISNYGFRVQYNRLFKNEYLPGRVKYNTFFFFAVAGSLYAFQKSRVSSLSSFVNYMSYMCMWRYYSCGVSSMSLRLTSVRDAITAFPVALLIQSPTAWTDPAWPRTTPVLISLSENLKHKNETYLDHKVDIHETSILFNLVQKYIH